MSAISDKDNKYIIYGGPDPVNIKDGCTSLGGLVLKRLKENGNTVALIDGVTSNEVTYLDLLEQSVQLADSMRRMGVRKDDVVGIISENRLEFPVVLFASFYLGATVAPVNLTYTEREFDHALSLSRPKIVFTSPYAADKVVEVARKNSAFVKKVILFGDENPFQNVTLLNDFIQSGRNVDVVSFTATPVNIHEQVGLIMCSSGTTGLPKGVQLTHFNMMTCVAHLKQSSLLTNMPTEGVVLLGVIPWFHTFGCLTLINVTCNKHKLVSLPKFEEGLFLSCIENYKVTMIFMVPPLMVFLAKHPLVDNYDLSSLQVLLCGAAPLSKEIEDLVLKRLPSVLYVRQGYGMSETTLGVLSQTRDVNKHGSVGTVQTGMWAKVIDPETGVILGPNTPGELCFKGSQIMKGYIGNDAATRDTIDKDGWLHSGDVAYYDEDFDFFIVDRLKELIKYKAYQVPPAEIEAILLSNPKIKDAAVIGLPDENAGELPLAFVVKQDNCEITENEIKTFVANRTSAAKRLHGGVRFISEIPKNLSGKILRRELRALLVKTPKAKL